MTHMIALQLKTARSIKAKRLVGLINVAMVIDLYDAGIVEIELQAKKGWFRRTKEEMTVHLLKDDAPGLDNYLIYKTFMDFIRGHGEGGKSIKIPKWLTYWGMFKAREIGEKTIFEVKNIVGVTGMTVLESEIMRTKERLLRFSEENPKMMRKLTLKNLAKTLDEDLNVLATSTLQAFAENDVQTILDQM